MILPFVMLVNAANMFDYHLVPLLQLVHFRLNYYIVISGHRLFLVYQVLNIISLFLMIILTIYGRFLFVLNRMLTLFLLIFANMPLSTSAFPSVLFNVTMVVNSIMLEIAISFSPLVLFFGSLAPIPLPKTEKLKDPSDPLTTLYAPYSFRPLSLLVFGQRHFAPPPFFSTFDPPKHALAIHPFNLSF